MAVDPSGGDAVHSSPAKPGIRVVGGRIYDSANGKTCHQCRQKTTDFVAACKNQRNNRPCSIKLCRRCLLNRYGENAEEVAALGEWSCPKCRGICNCSVCMKKQGHQPTGILITTAKATGFSSVSEMLLKGDMSASLKKAVVVSPRKNGKENSFDGKVDGNLLKPVDRSSKKVKRVLNGNIDDSNSSKINNEGLVKRKIKPEGPDDSHNYNRSADVLSNETGSHGCEKKPKKMKRDRVSEMNNNKNCKEISVDGDEKKPKKARKDGLEKSGNSNKEDRLSEMKNNKNGKEISVNGDEKKPKKPRMDVLEKSGISSNKEDRLSEMKNNKNGKEISVNGDEKKPKKSRKNGLEKNGNSNKEDLTLARRTSPRKLKACNKLSNLGAELNGEVDLEENANCRFTATKKNSVANCEDDKRKQEDYLKGAAFYANISFPVGTELTSVAGIDVRVEDVGNALQFLEFCSVFGKILEVRKGQAEYVLKDLFQGRPARRGKISPTVQFLIHLLSVIQTEKGEKCATLSPSYWEKSWFDTLKKCLSESQSFLEVQGMHSLQKASDYETLNASQKLRVLNLLCDEVLGTEKLRTSIEDQNRELAEKVKEARQKVLAAKEKEKSLKQKMKDDIAEAIIARDGAPLTISEQEAIISNIKLEAAEAHAEVLESQEMLMKSNQASHAVRIEPLFMEHGGHAYWKLNCSGRSDLLHQNVGKGDTLTLDEKWSALDVEGKEFIEKHISVLRGKKLRALKVSAT